MRHRKKFNHLGRKSAHRKETLSSLATSLILHKRINTTVAKAKALRVFVEPLITKSKVDSTHSRRTVFGYLRSKQAVSELFRDVAQKVADRPGGYTRILKTGFRKGDSAEMCFIELVDYNANMFRSEEEARQKTTRRAGRRSKSGDAASETSSDEARKQIPAVAPAEEVVADSQAVPVDEIGEEADTQPQAEVAEPVDIQQEVVAEPLPDSEEEEVAKVPTVSDEEIEASPKAEKPADTGDADESDKGDAAEADTETEKK